MEKLHVGQLAILWLVAGVVVWGLVWFLNHSIPIWLGLAGLAIIIGVVVRVLVITWRWFGARASQNGR